MGNNSRRLIVEGLGECVYFLLGAIGLAGFAAAGLLLGAFVTFVLVTSVFGIIVHPRALKIGGFAIGLMVVADIFIGGHLTRASMNPARTFDSSVAYEHFMMEKK